MSTIISTGCTTLNRPRLESCEHVSCSQDIVAFVAVPPYHALQGTDDSVAHVFTKLRFGKVVPLKRQLIFRLIFIDLDLTLLILISLIPAHSLN